MPKIKVFKAEAQKDIPYQKQNLHVVFLKSFSYKGSKVLGFVKRTYDQF